MQRRDFLVHSARVLGVAASGSVLAGALAMEAGACVQEGKSCLDQAGRATVAALAELIIPATDTPGAGEAGVPGFIDEIVSRWYTAGERKIFLAGLLDIDRYCQREFGRDCRACSTPGQIQALRHFEAVAATYVPALRGMFQRSSDEDTPFFSKLKELSTFAYFTSEIGARQALEYNPVPGQYLGDYPLERVGKAWSS